MSAPRLNSATLGQRVFAYKNLTRGCWSLKALDGASKGKVIAHLDTLAMTDCTVKASVAQIQWMRAKGARQVCCGINGTLASLSAEPAAARRVTFHPFERDDMFYADTGETFTGAARMTFTLSGAYA